MYKLIKIKIKIKLETNKKKISNKNKKQKFFLIRLHLLHLSQDLEERTSRSVPRGEDGTRNISIPPGRDIVILSLNFYVVIIIPFIVVVTGGA